MAAAALAAAVAACSVAPPAMAADGAAIFANDCSACHQPDGEGAPGVAPPLRSSVWPTLGASAPRYIGLVLLNGLTGKLVVDGQVFNGGMPTHEALSDEDLAAVATHVLKTLNGLGAEVSPEAIAKLRGAQKQPSELRAIRAGGAS